MMRSNAQRFTVLSTDGVSGVRIFKWFLSLLLLLVSPLLLLLLLLLTAIQLSLGISSPYTSTDKTNKTKYT
jgi:hypothetical protein